MSRRSRRRGHDPAAAGLPRSPQHGRSKPEAGRRRHRSVPWSATTSTASQSDAGVLTPLAGPPVSTNPSTSSGAASRTSRCHSVSLIGNSPFPASKVAVFPAQTEGRRRATWTASDRRSARPRQPALGHNGDLETDRGSACVSKTSLRSPKAGRSGDRQCDPGQRRRRRRYVPALLLARAVDGHLHRGGSRQQAPVVGDERLQSCEDSAMSTSAVPR